MSIPTEPKPAKLVASIFLKDKSLISQVADDLTRLLGPVDMISPWFPFNYTSYYEPEMGSPLFRRMFAFQELIPQDSLAEIKCVTNDIEKCFSKNNKRKINIDPGYLNQARFVLATGKDYSHRIYIGKGIYGDLTLIYQKGAFEALPWTYPDYADETMRHYLKRIRDKYIFDLNRNQTND